MTSSDILIISAVRTAMGIDTSGAALVMWQAVRRASGGQGVQPADAETAVDKCINEIDMIDATISTLSD